MPFQFVEQFGTVKTTVNLRIRKGEPGTRDIEILDIIPKGDSVNYIGWVKDGESLNGNPIWYKNLQGNYFWAGGTDDPNPKLKKYNFIIESGNIKAINILNIRKGKPNTRAAIVNTVSPDSLLSYIGWVTDGEEIEGNSNWFKDKDGNYFNAKGTDNPTPKLIQIDPSKYPPELINWSQRIDWNPKNSVTPPEWRATEGKDIKVAVLDSGIFAAHPDLKHIKLENIENKSRSGINSEDYNGHGSHCAGLINAITANQDKGIIGVAPKCTLYVVKISDEEKSHNATTVANGIAWAIQQKVDVISMSFEVSDSRDGIVSKKLVNARNQNIVLVAAAGEATESTRRLFDNNLNFPAIHDTCIAVGAVEQEFLKSNQNPYSQKLDFLFPFIKMWSCDIADKFYSQRDGSSMVTAFMSGIIASLLSHLKFNENISNITNDLIKQKLNEFSYSIEDEFEFTDIKIPIINPHKLEGGQQ